MSVPIVTPSELELYLDLPAGTINSDRAFLLIAQAQQKCERIVSPITPLASDIVLEVAGRAYINVTSARQLGIGSAHVSFGADTAAVGVGGLYLTRANKAELRLIAGRGSAFSADTLPPGTNAVQTVIVAATAGTFTLYFMGATTPPLAFNATSAVVQTALSALPTIGAGNVTVTDGYVVTFVVNLATQPLPTLVADGTLLTGTVTTATSVIGVFAPGQNLAQWNIDRNLPNAGIMSQTYGW